MKKLFICAMISLAFISNSYATSKSDNPSVTKDFNKLITNNQVSWKITDQFKKASMIVGGEKIDVFYARNGNFIGSSKTFAYDRLPKPALRTISLDYAYPEYSLIECIVFEKEHQETKYYVSLKKGNDQVNLQINESGSVDEIEQQN
jgi:hypothetical protein